MSPSPSECPPPISTTDEETVSVSVSALINGSDLQMPLYDAAGVLLAAEGTTITSDLKKRLINRGLSQVRVSRIDAKTLVLDDSFIDLAISTSISSEFSEQLDQIIDQGMLYVKNEGPALQDSMVFHGRKAFDSKRREEMILQHQATSESLDSMMKEAASGRQLNGKQITQLVATYLTDMTEDKDCVLSVAFDAQKQGIVEQSMQTSLLAMKIGVSMRLNAENVRTIGIAGLVHDWGMTKVPDEILNKQGMLNPVEFLEIQKHSIATLELLKGASGIPTIVPLVAYQVHERLNGTGYPRGRCGESIHLFARILSVADTYSALTSPKPYRKSLTPYAAIECLLRQASTKSVDAMVVKGLINGIGLFPVGSFVALDDRSIAQVLRPNRDKFSQPIVQIVRDPSGARLQPSDATLIDLSDSERQVVQALPTPGKDEQEYTEELLTSSGGTYFFKDGRK